MLGEAPNFVNIIMRPFCLHIIRLLVFLYLNLVILYLTFKICHMKPAAIVLRVYYRTK